MQPNQRPLSDIRLIHIAAFGVPLRPASAAALSGPRRGKQAVSCIACPQPLPSYSGDIATNPDEAHDTTWGTAGVPYIAMASSQVSAGKFVGFSVTALVS